MLRRLLILAFSFLAIAPVAAQSLQRDIPQSAAEVTLSYAPAVKRATPAVVNVYASRVERRARNPLFDDPVFQQFFGGAPRDRTAQSLGSGVIVDASGLVVTNHHVIEGMTDVKVALSDRREYEADIVLRDPRTDLAVLRLRGAGPFPVLELGDSDALEVGDLVLAIGNPFGVGQTVTHGIVSALARTQVGISDYGFFIQTDAAINPGNSGGALIDMKARLVGINSAIYSKSGGSIGIGFAIPVNMVRIVVASAKGGADQVKRAWIGATLQPVTQEVAESLSLARPAGALVSDLVANGPASEAGLRKGDVIVSVDKQAVDDPESFGYRIGTKPLGAVVALSVIRSGKTIAVPLKLTMAPEQPPREAATISGRSPFEGAHVVNISPATQEEFAVEAFREGVIVTGVEESSTAASWLRKGDVILAINNTKINRTNDLKTIAGTRQSFWKVSVGRAGQVLTTILGG